MEIRNLAGAGKIFPARYGYFCRPPKNFPPPAENQSDTTFLPLYYVPTPSLVRPFTMIPKSSYTFINSFLLLLITFFAFLFRISEIMCIFATAIRNVRQNNHQQ